MNLWISGMNSSEYEIIQAGFNGCFYRYNDKADLMAKIHFWCFEQSCGRDQMRDNCIQSIEKNWNSESQIKILEKVLTHL